MISISEGAFLTVEGIDSAVSQLVVFPFDIDDKSISGAESFDGAVRPGIWQGREEDDLAVMALQQHLGDAGSGSEVPIDLERGVEAKEVRRGGAGKDHLKSLFSLFPIAEPGPQVNQPGGTPSGVPAAMF